MAVFGSYAPSLWLFRAPMMRAMVAAGHEVIGLAPDGDQVLIDHLASIGVAYRHVPLGRTGLNPLEDLRSILAIRAALKELKPDVLLSYTIKPVIYGSYAASLVGVPHCHAMVTGLGSSLMGEGFKRKCMAFLSKWLYRKGLARVEGVFFQNPDNQAFFEANRLLPATCRITQINGSGVDLAQFPLTPQPAVPLTFLLVGRMTREKGIVEFVEAARRIKAKHPATRFHLLGGYDTNPSAISEAQIQAWVNEGVVQYLGTVKDVRPMLAEAQVMVLPSYGEGTPRSVLEAMAMGRAAVTTLAPGCKETVIDGQTGFLVPPKNIEALTEAMERFIADPGLATRMGIAARAYAEDKYDVDKVNAVIMKAMGL
ncbi:glycosyltransferase family 4 protein [Geothrix sp. PMB-07]|uniref:glycosyltransferase family 4 protein n=1 Tax=Geothrix sp. PMB-07 TaxID=3068640 RepID=UPI002740D067|nr:glycosyltransferase family 4 protein [Geothrix sp. PMB-07]WLT30181.1 glycosyltransferase family 4 protein [Geothrix sp. PMB-07]